MCSSFFAPVFRYNVPVYVAITQTDKKYKAFLVNNSKNDRRGAFNAFFILWIRSASATPTLGMTVGVRYIGGYAPRSHCVRLVGMTRWGEKKGSRIMRLPNFSYADLAFVCRH